MTSQRLHAFALVESIVSVLTLAVLTCLLLVAASHERSLGWQAGSIANLHEFATATSSYAADNSNLFWSYSWQTGVATPSQYPDLQTPPVDTFAAAAAQAVDILRRRANRPDMPVMTGWAAPVLYHMLPLADYLDAPLPLRFAVSPGDRNRLLWSNDIEGFDQGAYLPVSPDPSDPLNLRWPYSSSYRVPLAFCSPDATTTTSGTFVPGSSDINILTTTLPAFNVGNRHITEVTFPSQKVQVFDSAQWQGAATPIFAAYSFARVPMLMVDGSARVRVTGQANPGFQPGNPRALFPTVLYYSPQSWEPPLNPAQSGGLVMRYFWTRAGIRGRDYEGDETDTSNW